MQYLVIKHDYSMGKSTTLAEYSLRVEAMDKIENVVFDFILQKEGDYALANKKVVDEKTTELPVSADKVRGNISRVVPTCLFREYSTGSSNWNNAPDGYIVVRNSRESLNRLTVLKKTTIPGWITNECKLEKIFYVDIVEYVVDEFPAEDEYILVNTELVSTLVNALKNNEVFQAISQLKENN